MPMYGSVKGKGPRTSPGIRSGRGTVKAGPGIKSKPKAARPAGKPGVTGTALAKTRGKGLKKGLYKAAKSARKEAKRTKRAERRADRAESMAARRASKRNAKTARARGYGKIRSRMGRRGAM